MPLKLPAQLCTCLSNNKIHVTTITVRDEIATNPSTEKITKEGLIRVVKSK